MAEAIMLAKMAQAAGLPPVRIMETMLIFFMVLICLALLFWRVNKTQKDMAETAAKAADKAVQSIDNLTHAFREHLVQNDLRLTEGDQRFDRVETRLTHNDERFEIVDQRLTKIEVRIGPHKNKGVFQ